jgi:endonuclease/exonuclease/phosphatase family metal-dependent hydrolase
MEHVEELMWLADTSVLKEDRLSMIYQSSSPQDVTSHAYAHTNMPPHMHPSQLTIVSFNIWDLPYWFVQNRQQRMLHIAAYLQRLDAEIICLQESFDVHHRRLLYEQLGCERYYASGGFDATRQVPLASFDTTGGLVIFSKFPILQSTFTPFRQFTPSVIERIGRKGVLEATIDTPYGVVQLLNIHLHVGKHVLAHRIRVKQLKSVLELMQSYGNVPIILAGDFNENALMEQKQFAPMLQSRGLTHSLHFEQYEFMPSYRIKNPLVNTWLNRSKYSRRLDYILVRLTEECDLKVVQYEPMYLIPPLSDHDPILLSLSSDYA